MNTPASSPIKLVALNGSPKSDGHTAHLLKKFCDASLQYGTHTWINLYEENIPPVTGELDIPVTEKSRVQQALLDADGFVLATPIYWFNVPGVVKNFIDHLTVLEDNGWLLEGKVAGMIVYSPEGGSVNTLQNVAMVFNQMGITVPPYSLIFDRATDAAWVKEDIPLMAHSIAQQVYAHQKLKFHWNS